MGSIYGSLSVKEATAKVRSGSGTISGSSSSSSTSTSVSSPTTLSSSGTTGSKDVTGVQVIYNRGDPITDVKSGLQLTTGQGVVNVDGGTTGGGTSIRTYSTPYSSSSGLSALSTGVAVGSSKQVAPLSPSSQGTATPTQNTSTPIPTDRPLTQSEMDKLVGITNQLRSSVGGTTTKAVETLGNVALSVPTGRASKVVGQTIREKGASIGTRIKQTEDKYLKKSPTIRPSDIISGAYNVVGGASESLGSFQNFSFKVATQDTDLKTNIQKNVGDVSRIGLNAVPQTINVATGLFNKVNLLSGVTGDVPKAPEFFDTSNQNIQFRDIKDVAVAGAKLGFPTSPIGRGLITLDATQGAVDIRAPLPSGVTQADVTQFRQDVKEPIWIKGPQTLFDPLGGAVRGVAGVFGYQDPLQQSLIDKGFTPEQAKQIKSRETAMNIQEFTALSVTSAGIESKGQGIFSTAFSKQGTQTLTKKQTISKVKDIVGPKLEKLGQEEFLGSALISEKVRGYDFNLGELGAGAYVGGKGAKIIGSELAVLKLRSGVGKTGTTALKIASDIADPTEPTGDFISSLTYKGQSPTLSRIGGGYSFASGGVDIPVSVYSVTPTIGGGRIQTPLDINFVPNQFTPAINTNINLPSNQQVQVTQKTNPYTNIFVPTKTQTSTFIQTQNQINVPANVNVPTNANVPTNILVPVNINVPTNLQTPTNINVPTQINVQVSTPQIPLFDLDFGGLVKQTRKSQQSSRQRKRDYTPNVAGILFAPKITKSEFERRTKGRKKPIFSPFGIRPIVT